MSTPIPDLNAPSRKHRNWSKKTAPADVSAVFRDYDGGMTSAEIRDKYGVSKTTLYRWINEYAHKSESNDPVFLRARIASLENAVLALSTQLAPQEPEHVEDRSSVGRSDPRGRGIFGIVPSPAD